MSDAMTYIAFRICHQKVVEYNNYYHLMMDYEDPSIENWREYKPDGQPLLLMYDDIVITRKGI